jgi:hypothetical protein
LTGTEWGSRQAEISVKEGSISFLKKRNKKLLLSQPAQVARDEGNVGRGGGE